MKRLLFSTLLVVILLNASIPNEAVAKTSGSRKRFAAVCSAILATTTVGLSFGYSMTGRLPTPGFGSPVVWASDRRAAVALLARALGIKDHGGGGDFGADTVIESHGFAPEFFKGVTEQEVAESTYVTETHKEAARGYLVIRNVMMYFELSQNSDGSARVVVNSSPN